MALFEVEGGRLVPAQFGRDVPGGFSPAVLDAVRAQILEVIARPLFPITWGDVTGGGYAPSPTRLTALDAAGQVVAVEVVEELDADGLIESLSKLADTAAMSWADLARQYPRGVGAFKEDWVRYREAMPTAPPNGPRIILVAAKIADEVRPALDVLSASGVEVHEMSLRQMRNGRAFLEVETVGQRLYTHRFTPVLEDQADAMPLPEAKKKSEPTAKPTVVTPPSDRAKTKEKRAVPQAADRPRRRVGTAAPDKKEAVPSRRPKAAKPAKPTKPAKPASAARPSRPVRHVRPPAVLAGTDRPAPEPPASRASRRSAIPYPKRSAHHADHPEPARHSTVDLDSGGLKALGAALGEPTRLVLGGGYRTPFGSSLTEEGEILIPPKRFSDPNQALAAFGVHDVDGWGLWLISDGDGPSLREAIEEIS